MKLKKAGTDAAPAADGAPAPTAPAKGVGNNLVPAVVIAIGLLGGGFFMGGKAGGSAGTVAPPAAEAAHAETEHHGPVQSLDAITLNLADGHFLKIGLALQMAPAEEEGGGHGGGGGEELAPAKALDIAITLLGSYTMEELADPKERELVKSELSELVAEAYVDPETRAPVVTKVYFTEFVMQ